MKSNNIRPCVIGLGYVGLPIFSISQINSIHAGMIQILLELMNLKEKMMQI